MNWGIKYRPQRGPFAGFELAYQHYYGVPVLFSNRTMALLKSGELLRLGGTEFPMYPDATPCTEQQATELTARIVEYYSGRLVLVVKDKQLFFTLNPKPPKPPRTEHKSYAQLQEQLLATANRLLQSKAVSKSGFSLK